MRRKKKVLLCCVDYERRNDLAFLLRVRCPWGRFDTFHHVEELQDAIENGEPFDCLVLALTAGTAHEAVAVIELMRHPEVSARAVEIRGKSDLDRASLAGRKVAAGDMAELAEAISVAARRKRGPRRPAAAKEMVA
jgi:hypothetical protein